MKNLSFPRIRNDVRQLFRGEKPESEIELPDEIIEKLTAEEIEEITDEAVGEVEERTEEMAEEQGQNLNMNKSFGTLITDPDVEPFDEMDATIGEIQEDVESLEELLETLGEELEMQEREYKRVTDGPDDESVTARQLRAQKANKERLMYTAKLQAFKDIRDRLERKVRLLSEMVGEVLSTQADQNYDVRENVDQVEAALGQREQKSIGETRDMGRVDDRLDTLQNTGDMSVQKDMEVIREKSGEATQRRSALSELAEAHLSDEESEEKGKNEKAPKKGRE